MELFIFLFTMKRTPSNLFLSSHLSGVEKAMSSSLFLSRISL